MLRVGVFPADRGGCGHYRLIWPWREVARQFGDVLEVTFVEEMQDRIMIEWSAGPWGDGEPTEYHVPQRIMEMPDIDVAVFQRPLHSKMAPYFKLLRERGIFVVVDLDDNFDRISTKNTAWFSAEPHWMREDEMRKIARIFGEITVTKHTSTGEWHYVPAHNGATNRRNVRAALAETDLLIVSTPALARHYGPMCKGSTVIIDNYVDEQWTRYTRDVNILPIIGWTGSVATHPNDLQEMGGAFTMARRRDDTPSFIWKVVGTGKGVEQRMGEEPDETTEWVDLVSGEYMREYATFDIAVCPLEDSAFNHAKSWLKGIEAAAVGVVPIMSPLSEYRRLNADGIGLIAKRPRDWERHLRDLLMNPSKREELAARGREVVREKYTMQGNAHRWVEALLGVMKTRTAAHAP